jgi:hypothetical protein
MKNTKQKAPATPGPTPAVPPPLARSLSGSPETALPAPRPLALILAGVAAPVWGVAGLALCLTLLVPGILVLALSASLILVLAPLVLACRSWTNWRSGWLWRPAWLFDPGSWLCWCWLGWPWLCWRWLSQLRHVRSRVLVPTIVAQGALQ